jgi:hypothetical protein
MKKMNVFISKNFDDYKNRRNIFEKNYFHYHRSKMKERKDFINNNSIAN